MLCLFQMFCSQLELLIQQLYVLSQSMEKMAAPAGDILSVKSRLADYQVTDEPPTCLTWLEKHESVQADLHNVLMLRTVSF